MRPIDWYIVSELAQLKFSAQVQTKEGTYSHFERINTNEVRCRLQEKNGSETELLLFPETVLYGILLNAR